MKNNMKKNMENVEEIEEIEKREKRDKFLFDAHTHLNFEEFSKGEREELAKEIDSSNLRYIIDAGCDLSSSILALENARKYEWCYAASGIHPEYAEKASDEMIEEIKMLAKDEKCVAIGEIGLDFHYGKDYKEEQIILFRKQLRLALEMELPIMIHSRDADQLTMDILKDEGVFAKKRIDKFSKDGDYPEAKVQLHCFSGSKELAMEYIKLGATISVGGPVTFKNGKKTAEVVRAIPIERLLSETDAPYLTPEPFRGKMNKSQYVEYVVRRIAILKDMEFEETALKLLENGIRFFGIK